MQKYILVFVALGVVLNAAADTTYRWSGGGDGRSWADGDNWSGNAPGATTDRVQFWSGDDVEVELPANQVTDIQRMELQNSGKRKVTFCGTKAVLRLNYADSSYAGPFVCSPNGELTLKIPVINASSYPWCFYNQQAGTVNFLAVMTNANSQSALIAGGTNYFGTGSGFYGPSGQLQLGNDTKTTGRALVELNDNAFINVNSLWVGGNSSAESCSLDFVIDGDSAKVVTSGALELGKGGNYETPSHAMILNSGTVTVGGLMTVAENQYAVYRQSGGTCTVGALTFGSGTYSGGEFEVTGGRFETKGVITGCTSAYRLRLEDCTFAVDKTSAIAAPLTIAGEVTFELPSGVTLTLQNVAAEHGAKIRKSGDGTLLVYNNGTMSFEAVDSLTFKELRVGYGESANFRLMGGALTVTDLYFGNTDGSQGYGLVSNATLTVTSGVHVDGKNYLFALADNSTFSVANDVNFDIDVGFSGKVTVVIPSGKTMTLAGGISFATGAKLVKRGAGTLVLDHDLDWRGDLDIVEGQVRFTDNHLYANADGDETVRRVDVRAAGNLHIDSYAAEITSPIDLNVEDGGYVYIGDRSLLAVRHYYLNDVQQERGQVLSQVGTSTFRGDGEGYSVLAIPYVWTGAGNNTTYNDPANWEGDAVPAAGKYLDLSQARQLQQDSLDGDSISIGGIIFNPSSGTRELVITKKYSTGSRNSIGIDCAQYQPAMTVGRGARLIFDNVFVQQKGSSDWSLQGGGSYSFRGNDDAFFGGTRFDHNVLPAAKLTLEYATNLTTGITQDFAFYGLGDHDRYSQFVFGDGLDFYAGDFHWSSGSGMAMIREMHQLDGSKVSFDNFNLTAPQSAIRGIGSYCLEGGELICRTAFNQGYPGLNFVMSGGTLRTPKITCGSSATNLYLEGGDIYLGAGGLGKSAGVTPFVQWSGAKLHATAAFASEVGIVLSGTGGNAVMDTAGYDVTMTGGISGKGTLAKQGMGTLTLNGALAGCSLNVSSGVLAFGSSVTQSENLKSIVAGSEANLTVASGVTIKVNTLRIGTTAKSKGTYTFGSGSIQVAGDSDWLASAQYSETYTHTCKSTTVSGLYYACAVSSAGTLTIKASGGSTYLTLNANAEIYIRAGDTVILQVPTKIKGDVTVKGGGTLIVEGSGRFQRNLTSLKPNFHVTDGSTVIFRSIFDFNRTFVTFYTTTAAPGGKYSCIRVEDGGSVKTAQTFSPTVGSGTSYGGTLEVAGGTFEFTGSPVTIGGSPKRCETLRLLGGTLALGGQLALASADSDVHIELEGGTIDVTGNSLRFLPSIAVDLNGDVTIKTSQSETQVVSLDCNFVGRGTITKEGVGQLDLYGDMSAVRKLIVNEGQLNLSAVAMGSFAETAALDVASTATLRLDYDGTLALSRMYLDHKELKIGRYAQGVSPQKRLVPIVGDGAITASRGALPGNHIIMY